MIQARVRDLVHRDNKRAIFRRDLRRIIPFQIRCRTVPNINSFPERIVTGVESASVQVELVGKDEFIIFAVKTAASLCLFGGIRVDELGELEPAL